MKKRVNLVLLLMICSLCFVMNGCSKTNTKDIEEKNEDTTVAKDSEVKSDASTPSVEYTDKITFSDDQLYAVAYLGYQEATDSEYYKEAYLKGEKLETYTISDGEYYLIIPRYTDMTLNLYQNYIDETEKTLIKTKENCGPFLLQCNVSDIFSDAEIELSNKDNKTSFSPYISLKDGAVEIGDKGLVLNKESE